MKLNALGIEAWLSASHFPEPFPCSRPVTWFDEKTTTTHIRTSVILPSQGLNGSDYMVHWRISDSILKSLWCLVISTKPVSLEAKVEARLYMSHLIPSTQERSTIDLHGNPLKLLQPYVVPESSSMGSIRLLLFRLTNVNITRLPHGPEVASDIRVYVEDEHYPWIVFEFNFERRIESE
ncbi:hypothetical protein BDP27DRAFT_1435079 [Rhodocollybia butyracea]|uniref:Uncharacterized protein n=1 Tax=Rhodocollybia butyracea TaxID=206335 RepID=A0A9P5P805_9AGAR|nr:hypothetical protein BDP27DRAFT_1435079 [Rhodocollybia butyracea]